MSDQPTACSIADFCKRMGIARSTFYVLAASGQMPRTIKIGSKRRVITAQDEQAWLAAREREQAE